MAAAIEPYMVFGEGEVGGAISDLSAAVRIENGDLRNSIGLERTSDVVQDRERFVVELSESSARRGNPIRHRADLAVNFFETRDSTGFERASETCGHRHQSGACSRQGIDLGLDGGLVGGESSERVGNLHKVGIDRTNCTDERSEVGAQLNLSFLSGSLIGGEVGLDIGVRFN